ncbi:hypothetical protein OAM52_00890 [Flavobacteriaceae bacterium]|nr:hypothetical protein [Flavobacteriaceae bacterium]
MRNQLNVLFILSLTFFVFTCSEDDDETTSTPPRDRTEQQASDMDTLQNYFETHYYNSGALNSLSTYPTLNDIVITKLEEDETLPPNTTLLSDAVEAKTTTYKDVNYTYYILSIEEGLGDHPHFTDQVRVNYEGNTMDDEVFENSVNPIDLELIIAVPGWNRVIPQFKTSNTFSNNSDGTVTFENYGIGVMFLPSGLSYFNSATTGVPAYSCLVFKFELLQYKIMDHDNDFIPSYMEDEDDNMDVFDDNTDGDRFYNFDDNDDDGDGYKTFREVLYTEYTDLSRSGLEAQLQALTPLNSNQFFTAIEAKDDGTFSAKLITLEDTNGNGIPNYLDSTDAATIN